MGRTIEIDHWVLSQLAYLDIEGDLIEFYRDGELTVGDLVSHHQQYSNNEELKDRFISEQDYLTFVQLVNDLSNKNSKYYNWKITHKSDENNSKTGFVAYTIETNENQAIVTIRGSEPVTEPIHRDTDWYNNGTLLYKLETMQQEEAVIYISKIASIYDQFSITGHSLGGNNSLGSSVSADKDVRNKITAVHTFNAPGFNREFKNKHEVGINEMRGRIKEFQNEKDLVSSILHNLTSPIIIESVAKPNGISVLDPFNIDHHGLAFFAHENGMLKRTPSGQKNFTCNFVQNLTQGLEKLPNDSLRGLVNLVFAVWSGRISLKDMVIAGASQFLLNPIGTILGGAVTLNTIISAIVVIVTMTLAVTIFEEVWEKARTQVSDLYHSVIDYLKDIINNSLSALDRVHEFERVLFKDVNQFFQDLINNINSWWKMAKPSQAFSEIEVNINQLRNLADRLNGIQNKIYQVDRKLDRLTRLVDLEEKFSVFMIDINIGYDSDLMQCIQYLRKTAQELEDCERKLLKQALAISV